MVVDFQGRVITPVTIVFAHLEAMYRVFFPFITASGPPCGEGCLKLLPSPKKKHKKTHGGQDQYYWKPSSFSVAAKLFGRICRKRNGSSSSSSKGWQAW